MAFQSQSREEIRAWIESFHQGVDSLSTTGLNQFYTKDATLQYANMPEIVGLDSIVKFFEEVLPLLESMKHEIVDFDMVNSKIYLRCFITYVVKDDPENKKIRIPAAGCFHLVPEARKGEVVIGRFDAYLDASEVFARIEEVKGLVGGS